tara:strand:+ start:69 stop:500 length:432 start_codon:yes stop_codon:yes gene_type:complete
MKDRKTHPKLNYINIFLVTLHMGLPIITKIESRKQFQEYLESNPGVFVIKFGAPWCAPCKVIEDKVHEYFDTMPDNVQCANINIDECLDVYGFLKTKKMVKGIPALLAYFQGNEHYIPDEFIDGTKDEDLKHFFTTVLEEAEG